MKLSNMRLDPHFPSLSQKMSCSLPSCLWSAACLGKGWRDELLQVQDASPALANALTPSTAKAHALKLGSSLAFRTALTAMSSASQTRNTASLVNYFSLLLYNFRLWQICRIWILVAQWTLKGWILASGENPCALQRPFIQLCMVLWYCLICKGCNARHYC